MPTLDQAYNARKPTRCRRFACGGDGPWLALALACVGIMAVGLWQAPQRVNHDCAQYLQMAGMLLDGGVPYCDFVDTNPPLIIYLNVVPAALARTFGVSPIVVFHGLVIALVLVTGIEIYPLLRQPRLGLHAAGRGLMLLTWFAAYFLVDYRDDTGQREHLFILLYTPYLFLRIWRHRGGSVATWFAILLGLQAGIGCSLKPHFLAVAVAVEVVLLLATRRYRALARPENFALAGVVVLYVAHWLFVPAAMREAFFFRWLPLVSRNYHVYDVSWRRLIESLLDSPLSLVALAGVLIAMLFARTPRARLRLHLLALSAVGCMAMLILFIQQKGFSYHWIPFDTAGLLCVALLVVVSSRRRAFSPWLAAAGCLVFGVAITVWFTGREDVRRDSPEIVNLRCLIESHTQTTDRVLVIAPTVAPSHPLLLQTGRKPGSRYLCSFPINFFYGDTTATPGRPVYRRRADAPAEEQQFLRELEDDVIRLQPRLIIVGNSPSSRVLPQGFNTFDYLAYTGWVQDALAPYRELPTPGAWKVFERVK